MSANIERFTGLAGIYRKYRPGYPDELFRYLKSELGMEGGSRAAEVGSGTGIFAKLLLEHGVENVYAVEPNDDMRSVAEESLAAYPGFHSVKGAAEATGLLTQSCDFVFAVQAFHWFDQAVFRDECRRILKPGGRVVIIWNSRTDDPVMRAVHGVCVLYCKNFTGFSGHSAASGEGAVSAFFNGKYEYREFSNPVLLNREEFVGRNLSSSYAPREDSENYRAFIAGMEDIFDRFSKDGKITWGNATRCYCGKAAIS